MDKINKKMWIISIVACLLPLIVGLFIYDKLPEQVPSHWNAEGVVDGYSDRFTVILMPPCLMAVFNLLLPVLMKLDPKYKNMDKKLVGVIMWVIPVLSIVCSTMSYGAVLGMDVRANVIILVVIGLMFVAIGNYLPKTRQTYTLGIKLPWTLNSEENWNRTHRIGGICYVIGGILMIISAIILPAKTGFIAFMVILGFMMVIPTVYSYLLYRKGI